MADDHRTRLDAAAPVLAKTGKGPRIAILGAGFSGMGMAIRLRQEGFENFVIYEKADEVGGTWRENVYPGIACDVPSHLYSFSFEPNPHWSRRFSPGGEIWDYMKACARKYDLYPRIAFGKKVTAIRHDGAEWTVDFADGSCVTADYVVSGLGGLHEPNVPDIPGLDAFKGPMFHTAQWRQDVDLTGKRVAMIGSAASAIQVIPEIVDKVAHLDVYQRTPNWVMPRQSYAYPKWLQGLFEKVPLLARAYRGFYFTLLEWRFSAFKKNENYVKGLVRKTFKKHLEEQVQDPDLRAKLTPAYEVGCKRILISDNYLQAIQKDNVDLVTDGVAEITEAGVRTKDGRERSADVVILATGFKPFDILESIDVAGPSGRSLREAWKDGIAAHRTIAAPGFPNFFMLLGPNSGLGHNSVVLMIEAQVNYVIDLIRRAGEGTLIEPREEAAKAYDDRIQRDLQERVWATRCGAWYVDENGRNFTLYPHNVRTYLKEMKRPDFSEYSVRAAAH
ncbi:flavin-containing monooxygenase [Hyphococcus luteus]|uniref:4-hydroxyacetophenone monooxygenase n=1 Tax=Hyphococcus luteus TaxID=2058213 RepID=A0A2S7K9E2_9PROT|nr:NAD(P)/FAD-dependent oxidoreductase [Marinicaulis flavus]PQA89117.1 4-hydroxyacetophenone monooxygenase [Marinicaulis flavus]